MDAPFPQGMVEEIEEFLSIDGTRQRGQDIYPAVFETGLFFPLQRKAELASMMREARRIEPKVIYEIGADKGGGLYHWCKCLPSVERVIACEIRGTPYRHSFEKAFPEIEFLWLEESSYTRKAKSQVMEFLLQDKIDCLFIDGDKAAFETDFETYKDLLSENAIVFMHDIQDQAPFNAYHTVSQKHGLQTKEIVDTTDWLEESDKMVAGIAPSTNYEGWLRHWKGMSCGVGVLYLA